MGVCGSGSTCTSSGNSQSTATTGAAHNVSSPSLSYGVIIGIVAGFLALCCVIPGIIFAIKSRNSGANAEPDLEEVMEEAKHKKEEKAAAAKKASEEKTSEEKKTDKADKKSGKKDKKSSKKEESEEVDEESEEEEVEEKKSK